MKPKKRKKQQCIHCSEIINYNYIKRHSENCHVYTKLIINGVQCGVCSKVFETRRNVNQHVGHHHKDLCSEIRQKMNLDSPTKKSTKPGSEISTGQNAVIQGNKNPIGPGIAENETSAKGQLISKCPYEMIVSSKIPTKLFLDFCSEFFVPSWGIPGSFSGFLGT